MEDGNPHNVSSNDPFWGDGDRNYRDDLRSDITKVVEQSERSSEKAVSGHNAPTDATWTGRFFDYVGLGFILGPPVFLGEAFLKNDSINWVLMAAIFVGFWAVGGTALAAGLTWPKWRPSNEATAAVIEGAARNIWVWLAVLLAIAFGPALLVAGFSKPVGVPPGGMPRAPGGQSSLIRNPFIEWGAGAGPVIFHAQFNRSGGDLAIYVDYGQAFADRVIIDGPVAKESRKQIDFIDRFVRESEMKALIGNVTEQAGNQLVLQWGQERFGNIKVGITGGSYFGHVILVPREGQEETYPFMIIGHPKQNFWTSTIVGPNALMFLMNGGADGKP